MSWIMYYKQFDQTVSKLTVSLEVRNVWKMTFKNITAAGLEKVLMKIIHERDNETSRPAGFYFAKQEQIYVDVRGADEKVYTEQCVSASVSFLLIKAIV